MFAIPGNGDGRNGVPLADNKSVEEQNIVPEPECLSAGTAWNYAEQFLQSGNMTIGELAVNATENCSYPFKLGNREQKCAKTEQSIIKNIYELSELDLDVQMYDTEERNLTRELKMKHQYKLTKELVDLLEHSVSKHKLVLDKVTHIRFLMKLCNSTHSFNSSWISALLSNEEWESRITNKTQTLIYYEEKCEVYKNWKLFRNYVDPFVFSIIFIVGLVGNVSLLLMFALRKEVRTKANVMIFNLVVGDTLNLLINVPLHYVFFYSADSMPLTGIPCHLYAMSQFVFFGGSALSVVSLSIQRYFVIVNSFWQLRASGRCSAVLYVLTVWVLAILVSFAEAFNVSDMYGYCSTYNPVLRKMFSMLSFLFYCMVCPCVMAVFSVVTARHLRRSIREVQSRTRNHDIELTRKRSARVLMVLAFLFITSYVPSFTWGMVDCWFEDVLEDLPDIVIYSISIITYYLLFLNVCSNPVALYLVSDTFRQPIRLYMFRCWRKVKTERQDTSQPVKIEGIYPEKINI